MQAVATAALPVFALIFTGWLAARCRVLGAGATEALNRFVAYLALPVLLFHAMSQVRRDQLAHWEFSAAFAGGIGAAFLVPFLARRRVGSTLSDRSIEGLAGSYANAGYMGIPLCLALFGPDSLAPVIITMMLTVCVLFGVAVALIEFDRQNGQGVLAAMAKVARALLRNPLLVAPMLGLGWAATGIALPQGLDRYATMLGAAASPCALVTIGLFLAQEQPGGRAAGAGRMVACKLMVQPAVTAALAFQVFDMPRMWAWCAVLISALPIGTGPFMLAQLYGRSPYAASRAILLSTLGSVFTVSALVAWIGASALP